MDNVIQIKNVSKEFKVTERTDGLWGSLKSFFHSKSKIVPAVRDISFRIGQGELVGFIGSNGAGKTTTMKMLSGLLHPSGGEMRVLGFDPFQRQADFLRKISMVMGQKNQLWWDLPAIETFNLNRTIYEIPQDEYQRRLEEFIDLLDIKEIMYRPVRRLSLGQRMKCEIVAALLHRPTVLFLDEPTIGLDVVMQKKVREFIKEYNRKYNATVILTSHYMDDVKEVCQRVIMIEKGSLIFDGALDEMIRQNADYKLLVPIFNQAVKREELCSIGEVVSFYFPKAVIKVPRTEASKRSAELHQKYELDDLDINEPALQDIVSSLCTKG